MQNCTIAHALDIVGNRSAMLILREAFLGTRRFEEFVERVGVGEPAIASRLRALVQAGLLERVPYREPGKRTRHEYQLTQKGSELLPALTALRLWGDKWASDEAGPPVFAVHRDCGAPVRLALECERGHAVGNDETDIVAGPGLSRIA